MADQQPTEDSKALEEAQKKQEDVEQSKQDNAVDPNVGSATYEPLDQKSLEIQQDAAKESFDAEKETSPVTDLAGAKPGVEDEHSVQAKEYVEQKFKSSSKSTLEAQIDSLKAEGRAAGVGSNIHVDNEAKISKLQELLDKK